jgi:hypothetical protein
MVQIGKCSFLWKAIICHSLQKTSKDSKKTMAEHRARTIERLRRQLEARGAPNP